MNVSPTKPRLTLSIGVVGHRPNRLPEAARGRVAREFADAVALLRLAAESVGRKHGAYFAEAAPSLTLISALAEGADQMAAEAALERGCALAAVLPFDVEEYEKDFSDSGVRAAYRGLLAKLSATLILCGSRADTPRAYEAAGLTILDNADLLLAVWDGGPSAGRGGTTDLLAHAVQDGLPIVHVDANGEAATRLLWAGLADQPAGLTDLFDLPAAPIADALPGVIDSLVRPPRDPAEAAKAAGYFSERWFPRNWRMELPLLMGLLGVRRPRSSDFHPAAPAALADEYVRFAAGMEARVSAVLAPAYGWADALAIRYAQIFRGAYISNFLLAALAVAMAAGSLVGAELFGWHKWPFVLIEIAFICGVFANTAIGRRRNWHRRWLEAREAAERLRAAVPLWLLGRRARAPAGEEVTWTGWYVRALLRELGLCPTRLDAPRLRSVQEALHALVEDQRAYHDRTRALMAKIEHRLERVGELLFRLTLLVAVLYLVGILSLPHVYPGVTITVTALTAGLPALAAGTYGIRLIGDFDGTAGRSRRTEEKLHSIGAALRKQPASLSALRSFAEAASAAMLGDVAHWRLASESRELRIPG